MEEIEKQLNRRFVAGILLGAFVSVFIVAAVYMGLMVYGLSKKPAAQEATSAINEQSITKLKTLEALIQENYYKSDVSVEDQENGMYKGLISSLNDPYSTYYTVDELSKFVSDTKGIYQGIGAYVSYDTDLQMPRITGVIEGSPAEAAGLISGDIIYQVDQQNIQGKALEEVVAMIHGEVGTTVHLTLIRDGESDYIEMDLERADVEAPTVNTKVLDDNIGYLQITEFDEVTSDQFMSGMAELNENNIQGLIIDLRNNPGGSLKTVLEIARRILPKGTIVYTVDKNGNRKDYTCDGEHEMNIPIVVLVNQYSASASEILSGAIKDYQKGTLVGTTTYGKGIVQSVFNLKDGTAVKLTVSNYYTPSGNNIHKVGIKPDVEVEFDYEKYKEDRTDNQLDKAVEVMKKLLDK